MARRKKKVDDDDEPLFTKEEIQEIRAMLFKVSHTPGCITDVMYNRKEYQMAYFSEQEKELQLTEEEEREVQIKEAMEFLRENGYEIIRRKPACLRAG